MQFPKTPSFRLDGKKALVLGAGKGIGMAGAIALSEAGAEVTAVARTQEDLQKLKAHLNGNNCLCEIHALDVTDIPKLKAFIADSPAFDVLLNSAGTNKPAPAFDYTEENYDMLSDLNVKSAYFATVEVARKLVAEGKGGSLINVSSQMGHVGGNGRSVYCANKHAVEGFTKAMAWEWGEQGIRVNTICPTFIITELTRPMLKDEKFLGGVLDSIAFRRCGTIEDVMGGVVFLASDASALITGSAIMIDGGWTAR